MGVSVFQSADNTNFPQILFENKWVGTSASSGSPERSGSENTYEFWTPTALPATIETDFGESVKVNCACIAAHNLGTSGATVAVSVWTGVDYLEVATVSPADDLPLFIIFGDHMTERLRISLSGASLPSIGVVFCGSRTVVPSGVVPAYDPFTWSNETEVLGGLSLGGNFLGQRIRRTGRNGAINFGRVARSWFNDDGLKFVNHFNDGHPFFMAPSPASLPDEVGYCWRGPRSGQLRPRIEETPHFVTLNMSFDAYA